MGPPRRGAAGGAGRVLPWSAPRPFQEALSVDRGGGWFPAAGSRLGAAADRYARHGLSFSSSGLSSVPSSAGHRSCFSGARRSEARRLSMERRALAQPRRDGRSQGPSCSKVRPAPRSFLPQGPSGPVCPHCGRCAVGQPRRRVRGYAMARRTCSGRCFLLAIRRAELRVGTCVG